MSERFLREERGSGNNGGEGDGRAWESMGFQNGAVRSLKTELTNGGGIDLYRNKAAYNIAR